MSKLIRPTVEDSVGLHYMQEGLVLKELVKKLQANNFSVHLVETKEAAKELALSLIPPGFKIGMENSLTLRETGI